MAEPQPSWEIMIAKQPEKTLRRLPQDTFQRINQVILTLAQNPRPPDSHQLAGHDNLYRLRFDGWRIVYAVEEDRLIVLILEIVPRQQPERYRVDDEIEVLQEFLWDEEKRVAEQKYAFAAFIRQARDEKIRVLVVENNAASQKKLQQRISAEPDMDVVGTATDGEEAIWLTVDLKPDVVLMEVKLPGMNGFATSEIMLQQIPTIHIILMSTYSEPDYPRRARLAGAKEFLVKTITPRELLGTIRLVHSDRNYAAWYIIHTYPGFESNVKQNLLHRIESLGVADKILQVIVPGEAEAESEAEGDWQVSPGAILVEMILDEDTWYTVKNTPGITAYYGSEDRPTPLQPDQVEEMLSRLAVEALLWPEESSESSKSVMEQQSLELIDDDMLDTRRLEAIDEPYDEDLTRIEEELNNEKLLADNVSESEEMALAAQIQRGVTAQKTLETKQDFSDDEIEALEEEVAEGKEAKRRLLKANAGLVIKMVEPFIGRGLNYLDLIQQGNLGLLRAAETFDPQREYIFSVYATWWIRQAAGLAIDQAGMIRLPINIVETINKWVRVQRRLAKEYGRDPSPKEMALEMDLLSDEDVQAIKEALKNGSPLDPTVERRWRRAAAKIRRIMRIALEPISMSEPVAITPRQEVKVTAHSLRTLKLGKYVEISLSVADLSESLRFYERLGLKKVDEGEAPHPWAVLTDEKLLISLHQQSFPSPMLSYFDWEEISPKIDALKTLNVTVDKVQTLGVPLTPRRDNFVVAAEFEAYEGQRVRLIHPWRERTKIGGYMKSKCNRFGELSLKTENVEAAVSYWEQLGFQRIAGDDQPYPWATVTDGLIRLGLHQTSKFAKPAISYFAPDMPDRLKQLRKAGLKFLSERKDAEGQRIGAVVQSPDGQPFFLFTGQVANLN